MFTNIKRVIKSTPGGEAVAMPGTKARLYGVSMRGANARAGTGGEGVRGVWRAVGVIPRSPRPHPHPFPHPPSSHQLSFGQ